MKQKLSETYQAEILYIMWFKDISDFIKQGKGKPACLYFQLRQDRHVYFELCLLIVVCHSIACTLHIIRVLIISATLEAHLPNCILRGYVYSKYLLCTVVNAVNFSE